MLAEFGDQSSPVRQVMDAWPDGALVFDADRRLVACNRAGETYLGLLTEQARSGAVARLGDYAVDELLDLQSDGGCRELALNGGQREVSSHPLTGEAGVVGWLLLIRDVTRERSIEQLAQQQERLAVVGQLAAGVAHDFNNIMAVILLYAQMSLRAPDLPSKIADRLNAIVGQARRATDLIQQILDFSRQGAIRRQPLDLVPFLKEFVKLLRRTLPENIRISLVYGGDDYVVNVDPTRMQQACMNLAVNARDAMLDGGDLGFEVELLQAWPNGTAVPTGYESGDAPARQLDGEKAPPGRWIQLTVKDTGTGIAPDVLPRIFEPFFTTKSSGQGTGLGLAQVYGIVKGHGGEIDVSSQVGAGTTFRLYFPAVLPGIGARGEVETADLVRGSGETILVVEDNPAALGVLVESLQQLDYRPLAVDNGRQALAMMERLADQVKLVLTDAVMPEIGGIRLLRTLKQRYPTVKVVMLTGHPLDEELERLRAEGLSDWIAKPPTLEALAGVIARTLSL